MGVNSTLGTRVPEDKSRVVYVRMWTFGRLATSSAGALLGYIFVEALLRDSGVGARVILITCSKPARQIS